jgi:polysaccharide pyruvyl transferase WcaK-like protein
MPAVLITGPFGRRDPGEEAVLAALVRALPAWDPIVTSSDPEATAATHGCRAVSVRRLPEITRSLVRADAAIAAGRVFAQDMPPGGSRSARTLAGTAALLSAAGSLGKPAAMVGVGSGELATRGARALARELVRRSDLLVLRDGASAHSLGAAGAPAPFRVGADLAWTTLNGKPPGFLDTPLPSAIAATNGSPHGAGAGRRGRGSPRALTVALDFRASGVEILQRIAIALERVAAAGVEVRLQPWARPHGFDDDVRLAGVLAGMIGASVEVLPPPPSLRAAAADFEGSALVVALRYHALIGAATAGTPCLAVVHEPDLGDLARRLDQPAVSAGANPPQLADAVLAAIDHPPPSPTAIEQQIASAHESIRLLQLLLSGGRSPDANDLDGLPLEPPLAA